ncbi:MAG: N-acetylmuramoyl-L-alanine amidase [Patescibacteria group bacterium]
MNTGNAILILAAMVFAAGCNRSQGQIKLGEPPPDRGVVYATTMAPVGNLGYVEVNKQKVPKIDWDGGREKPCVVVIHHAAGRNLTFQDLSDAGFENGGYRGIFENGNKDPFVAPGTPPYSGHFWIIDSKIQETFTMYHWYIREITTPDHKEVIREQHLLSGAIGWGNGNWETNCEAINICLDGDYDQVWPSDEILWAIARIIVEYNAKNPIRWLVAHNEVRKEIKDGGKGPTKCPGKWFWDGGRERIIAMADHLTSKATGISENYPRRVRTGYAN